MLSVNLIFEKLLFFSKSARKKMFFYQVFVHQT